VLAKWLDGGVKDILAGQLHRRLTGNATGNQCARAVNAAATPTTHRPHMRHVFTLHILRWINFARSCGEKRRGKAKEKQNVKGSEQSQNKSSWKYFPCLRDAFSHFPRRKAESRTNSGGHFVITVAAISASTFCCFSNNYNSRPKRKPTTRWNVAQWKGQRKNTRQEKYKHPVARFLRRKRVGVGWKIRKSWRKSCVATCRHSSEATVRNHNMPVHPRKNSAHTHWNRAHVHLHCEKCINPSSMGS